MQSAGPEPIAALSQHKQREVGDCTTSKQPPHQSSWRWLWLVVGLLLFAWAPACHKQASDTQAPVLRPFSTQKTAIINGQVDHSQPAIGAITQIGSNPFCTGTLIRQQLVLTAAHCIESILKRGTTNVVFRVDTPTSPTQITSAFYPIAQVVAHPKYTSGSLNHEYDLGLLILQTPVPNVSPLPILRTGMSSNWVGRTVTVVGYGLIQTKPSIQRADKKYAADIAIIQVDARSFIHFDANTGKSACHGDSGGPALHMEGGLLVVTGVTSEAYKATPYPQQNITYCDGGAISTRLGPHIQSFLGPYMQRYADGSESCKNDAQCGPCGQCMGNYCSPKNNSPEPQICRPCRKDQDCGQGRCHRFADGYRCVPKCSTDGCCPQGYYCASALISGGSTPEVCLPNQGSCPATTCQSDTECGPGENCKDNYCSPLPPTPSPALCQPCYSSQQCGQGNLCYNSTSSIGYCLQACGLGRFCPKGFQCQTIAPGLEQCVPTNKGGCFVPCTSNTDCRSSQTCQSGQCVATAGGKTGDFCTDLLPCQKGWRCEQATYGSRCIKSCNPPSGTAGTACQTNPCQDGYQCVKLGSQQRVCLEVCENRCALGGKCFPLGVNFSACLCQSDQDCDTGQFCHFGRIGELGAGACTARPSGNLCPSGQRCQSQPPNGNYCQPKQGQQRIGESCSFLNRCKSGATCLTPPLKDESACYETCTQTSTCQMGGTCRILDGQQVCSCDNDEQCGPDATCELISQSSAGTYGLCRRKDKNTCLSSLDCPKEYLCQQGACVFSSGHVNEPFPELVSVEPTPEPSVEPQKEPSTPREPSPPEPSEEPIPTPPEPQPTDTTPDAAPQPEPPTAPEKTIEPPSTSDGCGCQSHQGTPPPFSSFLLLLGVFAAFARQRHR